MKRTTYIFATCGILLASCTESQNFDINSSEMQNPGIVNFSTTTTRASINTLTEVGANGFKVFSTEGMNNTFGINGEIYEEIGAGNWQWNGGAKPWPSVKEKYPMDFYALYPSETPVTVAENVTTIKSDITVPSDLSAQIDYLAGKNENIEHRPANGRIAMVFNHIMSKINVGIIPGENVVAHVSQVKLIDIASSATYNHIDGAYDAPAAGNESYPYITAVYDAETGLTAASAGFSSTAGTVTEDVVQPIYSSSDKNMMLLPQTLVPADDDDITAGTGNEFTIPTGKDYIMLMYRLTNTGNLVGYEDKESYPYDNVNGVTVSTTDPKYNQGGAYKGGLFVKVAFPMTAMSWDSGKSYVYNIKLGTFDSSGGFYMSKTYVDVNGNDTGLLINKDGDNDIDIDDTVNPGDPVNGGDIHFSVTVNPWDSSTGGTILAK